MDHTEQSPTVLSLCSGMLGLERGIERVIGRRVNTVLYSEIETFVVANLIRGMEKGYLDPRPIWSNLKTLPFELFRNKIHIITGGYPCQPFSVAGNRRGTEDHRHLWPYIERGVDVVRPPICFFENVPNHLNIGYEQVRGDLQKLGYSVKEGIYSAEEVGAPHIRKRLFILAVGNTHLKRWHDVEKGFDKTSNNTEWDVALFSRIWKTVQCRTEQPSINVANSNFEGLPKQPRPEFSSISRPPESSKRGQSGGVLPTSWPSRPGENQFEWEAPRVVKPGVGVTVDGYNFREDLLRLAGNGVVEQTAALAFRDLFQKLINENI